MKMINYCPRQLIANTSQAFVDVMKLNNNYAGSPMLHNLTAAVLKVYKRSFALLLIEGSWCLLLACMGKSRRLIEAVQTIGDYLKVYSWTMKPVLWKE